MIVFEKELATQVSFNDFLQCIYKLIGNTVSVSNLYVRASLRAHCC